MPVPKNIKILPELADYLDPLDPETFEKLKAQIAVDNLTDPICYAEITLAEGGTVNAIIDGHHRYRAAKEVGGAIKWRLIESVHTIEEAKAWMFNRQDGRRNWAPNRRAMYIAEAYEASKVDSGRRTDLAGGAKIDTALAIGEQFGVSDKTVTDAAKLYRAIARLTDTLGVDARKLLLGHTPPVNRDTIIDLAAAPEEQHRDAWQLIMKRDTAGAKALLAKAKRAEQVKRPGLKVPGGEKPSALELYPLPDLVRLIGSKWPVERLESWQPSYTEGEILEVHAEAALRSLIWIAEHYDWGQAALDDYLAEYGREAAQEPEDASLGASGATAAPRSATPADDAPEEPSAAPEGSTGRHDGSGADDLRERLRAALERLSMSQERFARHAEVSQPTLSKFLAGKGLSYHNRPKVEAALADLAGY